MIILATINARYSHAALGLRCLRANLGHWRNYSLIREFTLEERAVDIAEKILAHHPRLIALSVYIWNVALMEELIPILKGIAPTIPLIVGGPEVSHSQDLPGLCDKVDAVVQGAGEWTLPPLLDSWLGDKPSPAYPLPALGADNRPPLIVPPAAQALKDLAHLNLPHDEYTDEDLAHRQIYFEASRGCPFKCEFCLSALDVSAFSFPLPKVMESLNSLWDKGLRRYKFVDRTFNLSAKFTVPILDWFLDKHRANGELFFAHFEMIPDRLPEAIRDKLTLFPADSLQLEIGVQTWNPHIQALISRKQDNNKTEENLRFLMQNTPAHLHTDLIFGLPDESLSSMANGFHRLWGIGVHEIQVGVLKRLRGAPIDRHTATYAMIYEPHAPYTILANSTIDFSTMQALKRFARFWDLIGNSGRFKSTLKLWLATPLPISALSTLPYCLPNDEEKLREGAAFWHFFLISEALYARLGQKHQINLERLFHTLYLIAEEYQPLNVSAIKNALLADYAQSGAKGFLPIASPIAASIAAPTKNSPPTKSKPSTPNRQLKHAH